MVLFQQYWIMTDNEITYKIRGAIYKVYNAFGPGLLESVYEAALCHQLRKVNGYWPICVNLWNLWETVLISVCLSLAALHAERWGDCRQDGDDKLNDCWPLGFIHILLLILMFNNSTRIPRISRIRLSHSPLHFPQTWPAPKEQNPWDPWDPCANKK